MIERHALIESSSGIVKNIIQLDTAIPFTYASSTGEELVLLMDQPVSAGDHYNKLTAVFTQAQPSPDYVLSGTKWVLSLSVAKARQKLALSSACHVAIVAGFTSTALGTANTYSSDAESQMNISGRVQESLLLASTTTWVGKIKCTDTAGVVARRDHTHAQIRQLGLDAVAHISAQLSKLDQKQAAIEAALTTTAVDAIVWT